MVSMKRGLDARVTSTLTVKALFNSALFVVAGIGVGLTTGSVSAAIVQPYADMGDGTPRPTKILGLTVNSTLYDVTFTYNNNSATNPLRVGALPDADIPAAAAAVRDALNAAPADDAFITLFWYQPNTDTISLDPGVTYQANRLVRDDISTADDNWVQSTFLNSRLGTTDDNAFTAFPQFSEVSEVSEVPEPSTFAIWSLLGGIGLVAGRWRRRRKAA